MAIDILGLRDYRCGYNYLQCLHPSRIRSFISPHTIRCFHRIFLNSYDPYLWVCKKILFYSSKWSGWNTHTSWTEYLFTSWGITIKTCCWPVQSGCFATFFTTRYSKSVIHLPQRWTPPLWRSDVALFVAKYPMIIFGRFNHTDCITQHLSSHSPLPIYLIVLCRDDELLSFSMTHYWIKSCLTFCKLETKHQVSRTFEKTGPVSINSCTHVFSRNICASISDRLYEERYRRDMPKYTLLLRRFKEPSKKNCVGINITSLCYLIEARRYCCLACEVCAPRRIADYCIESAAFIISGNSAFQSKTLMR